MVGKVEFKLHEVVTAKDYTFSKQLDTKKGWLTLNAEESKRAQGLENVLIKFDGISTSKNSFFMIIWKKHASGKYRPVYKTETKPGRDGMVNWTQILLDTDTLCNDDDDHKLKIDLFEFKREGTHKLLGSTTTTLDEFKKGKKSFKIGGMKINVTSF